MKKSKLLKKSKDKDKDKDKDQDKDDKKNENFESKEGETATKFSNIDKTNETDNAARAAANATQKKS